MVSDKLSEDERVTKVSAGKVMAAGFWDPEEAESMHSTSSTKAMADILLLRDAARPHTSRHTIEEMVKIRLEVLPRSSYRPDLAP
ncbi:hypothetical protein Trydic_g970 [Trypoxylus dichotomus]